MACSLTSTHFCASRYSDVWIVLVLGCKVGIHIFLGHSLSVTNKMDIHEEGIDEVIPAKNLEIGKTSADT